MYIFETEKEHINARCPYMVIVKDTTYYLYKFSTPVLKYYWSEGSFKLGPATGLMYHIDSLTSTDGNVYVGTGTILGPNSGVYISVTKTIVWANFDLYDTDGNLYLAKAPKSKTTIKITPPGGVQTTIDSFESCQVTMSMTDRAGSASITLKAFDNTLNGAYPFGSDVIIEQNNSTFKGWISKPPISLNNNVRTVTYDIESYTSRTQYITVNGTYTNEYISTIIKDLFSDFMPTINGETVLTTKVSAVYTGTTLFKRITKTYSDVYLWDAMAELCKISGYDWFIDSDLNVNFFSQTERLNSITLSQEVGNYKRDTAKFAPDTSQFVNRLTVKGCRGISDPITKAITVSGSTPILFNFTPIATSGADFTVSGFTYNTVGIQNIDAAGTKGFLVNAAEKVLIPDLNTSGSGSIVYRYNYPVKIVLNNYDSQTVYGIFERQLTVDTDDFTLANEQGQNHLYKYSEPITTGSISPWYGKYTPGEKININIPDIDVIELLQIKQVTISSEPGTGQISTSLQLETPERNLENILIDMNNRLAKIEKLVLNDAGAATADVIDLEAYTDTNADYNYNVVSETAIFDDTLLCNDEPIISLSNSSGEYFRKIATTTHYISANQVRYVFYILPDEGNDTVTDISLYSKGATVGTLGDGTLLETHAVSIVKTAAINIEVDWTISQS